MSKDVGTKRPSVALLLAAGIALGSTLCQAVDDSSAKPPAAEADQPGLYMKVQLSRPVKISKLKPGDVVEGGLARNVYSADRKLFSAGSPVRLTVDHLEKRKRARNDHWPWIVQAFMPRHESYPIFKSATVAQDQEQTSLDVSMISISRLREVHAKAKKDKSLAAEHGAVEANKVSARKMATPIVVLEAIAPKRPNTSVDTQADADPAEQDSSSLGTLPAGTRCKILLLGNVSASRSKAGDEVPALLLEPVVLNSRVVLPAGTLFKGRVAKRTSPRWLSRSGSLYLIFTEVTLPEGTRLPIAASLAGAELDERSHTRMDAEGRLHGEHPGKAWMAINLGVSAGIAKVTDDGLQLIVEALISTATDVSTAGTGRIVSSCVSGVYMATRHGRDVVLPRFTEMELSLDHPLSLNPSPPVQAAFIPEAGKQGGR
jgi:hypothetical protein